MNDMYTKILSQKSLERNRKGMQLAGGGRESILLVIREC